MFKLENDKCYKMPVHFSGYPYQPVENGYHDVVSMIYTYKTDGAGLSRYIPEGFELLRPELTIWYAQCREIDWMAGSRYNLIDVAAPVRFNGRRDSVEGTYSFVVWENNTEPILGGREETGVSKIYADIEDVHSFQDRRFTNASFEGNTFLWLEMTVKDPVDDATMKHMRHMPNNSMHWRYIPKIGGPGADLSQIVLYPQRAEMKQAWHGDGTVKWTVLSWEQCPAQAHIIKALAELPVLEKPRVIFGNGAVYLTSTLARVLE
jgi:acetoacetate decarboxylase